MENQPQDLNHMSIRLTAAMARTVIKWLAVQLAPSYDDRPAWQQPYLDQVKEDPERPLARCVELTATYEPIGRVLASRRIRQYNLWAAVSAGEALDIAHKLVGDAYNHHKGPLDFAALEAAVTTRLEEARDIIQLLAWMGNRQETQPRFTFTVETLRVEAEDNALVTA